MNKGKEVRKNSKYKPIRFPLVLLDKIELESKKRGGTNFSKTVKLILNEYFDAIARANEVDER